MPLGFECLRLQMVSLFYSVASYPLVDEELAPKLIGIEEIFPGLIIVSSFPCGSNDATVAV